MRRIIAAVLLGMTVLVVSPGTAWADSAGSVNLDQSGGTVVVGQPGSPGRPADNGGDPGGSSGGRPSSGGGRPVSTCYYTYQPAPMYGNTRWGGQYQIRSEVCGGVTGPGVLYDPGPPGTPGAPPPPPPPPSGAEVAQMALSSFTLATPSIGMSTSDKAVVGFRQWFWLNGGWSQQSATASLRGVSATVVAVPTRALWKAGDGGSFTCNDAGARFRGAQDQSVYPACGYTYSRRSGTAANPTASYQVSARVSFHMTWSSTDGTSGDLGIITSPAGTAPIAVGEIQALNVPNPPGVGG